MEKTKKQNRISIRFFYFYGSLLLGGLLGFFLCFSLLTHNILNKRSLKRLLLFYFKQTLYPTTTGKDHDSDKSEVNWEVVAAGYDRKTQHF